MLRIKNDNPVPLDFWVLSRGFFKGRAGRDNLASQCLQGYVQVPRPTLRRRGESFQQLLMPVGLNPEVLADPQHQVEGFIDPAVGIELQGSDRPRIHVHPSQAHPACRGFGVAQMP